MARRRHPRPELSRRCALLGSLTTTIGLGLAFACSRKRSLALYNWGDYLAPQVIERFVAKHPDVQLSQDYYLSEAELVAKLRGGSAYDLAVPIDYLLGSTQRDGLWRELDPLPKGVEHLDPSMPVWRAQREGGPSSESEGGAYAVPYLWGTTGIGYDSEKVERPTSWNALFDDRYAGRISVIDSKGDVMDQALLASGLGINSTDKATIRAQVWPRLRQQKQLLRAYDSNPAAALISGDTWIAQIDSGDLFRAQDQQPSLEYVIPDEGAALWVDYLAIPARAAAPELALSFIEFLLDPDIAALNANTLRFATPNRTALDRGLIADAADPQLYPPPDVRTRLFTSENWDGSTKQLVDELWLELRSK